MFIIVSFINQLEQSFWPSCQKELFSLSVMCKIEELRCVPAFMTSAFGASRGSPYFFRDALMGIFASREAWMRIYFFRDSWIYIFPSSGNWFLIFSWSMKYAFTYMWSLNQQLLQE